MMLAITTHDLAGFDYASCAQSVFASGVTSVPVGGSGALHVRPGLSESATSKRLALFEALRLVASKSLTCGAVGWGSGASLAAGRHPDYMPTKRALHANKTSCA